jgi:hypothetical protein
MMIYERRKICFALLIIGLISVYDVALSVVYQTELPTSEQNPICICLINHYDVDGFLIIKSTLTIVVIGLLYLLSFTRWKYVLYIICGFQLGLLWYLNCYEPLGTIRDEHKVSPVGDVIKHFVDGEPIQEFK